MTLLVLFILILIPVLVIINRGNKKAINEIREATTQNAHQSNMTAKEAYATFSDYEKSELYFKHRIELVLRRKYPDLITWRTAKRGVSLKNQAVEVVIALSDNREERLWLNTHELIGGFYIVPEEIPPEEVADDSIPDDLRDFLGKYAGIIDKKIRFAVEHHFNYAYFEFRNGETEEFMQKICERIAENIDGIMCSIKEKKLEMNVQNMLDE